MTIKERKQLRINILKGLYDWYFEHNGAVFSTSRNNIDGQSEIRLAHKYLADKGFIKMQDEGLKNVTLCIEFKGIDFIEELLDSEGVKPTV